MGKRRYWLLKTEPKEWSWEDQRSNGGMSQWDGVKNRQALKHMKAMSKGDRCFFYHSGPSDRRIVGVVEVTRPWYAIAGEEGAVDLREVGEMRRPVHLKDIKAEAAMKGFALLRQPRLSVVPVPEDIWEQLCEMGGGFADDEEATPPPAEEEED
ncbi:thymocyte nuclear protein 1 [Phoenix dactylifera]|uniref:Thymocyte nuclear protein 1 n=1 Tax=Phoenix dactylifera TaxID=42345 RepID=A0A8B7CDP7_PHODC|nr:thymocyte nuclear protein 1 [Phoenix dactylifera]